ncbi:MAG: class I SAM-dependent methyltransferase [Dehalococcoidia bacterium]
MADTTTRMTNAELQVYWSRLSNRHLADSRDGFEVICYAGMPPWFNRLMHRYQVKAFRRLLRRESFAGADVLDVGTGVGRWARWYAGWPDARVVGIDIEPQRLARARSLGGGVRYEEMSADALTFEDASFDVINSVTVLQHVPHDVKRRAIAEMARVLRPGGRVVLFEVTDTSDDAPHVFPWSASQWRREFARHGFVVRASVGDQYIPVLRALKRVHGTAHGAGSRQEIDALKAGRESLLDRAKMAVLFGGVAASYPIEEICRFLPARLARISGFLFEQAGARSGQEGRHA